MHDDRAIRAKNDDEECYGSIPRKSGLQACSPLRIRKGLLFVVNGDGVDFWCFIACRHDVKSEMIRACLSELGDASIYA